MNVEISKIYILPQGDEINRKEHTENPTSKQANKHTHTHTQKENI